LILILVMINNAGTGRTINVAFNLIVAENFIAACIQHLLFDLQTIGWFVDRVNKKLAQ